MVGADQNFKWFTWPIFTLVSSTISAFKKIYTSKFASKLRIFVTIWLYDAFLCILLNRLWFHWNLHTWKPAKRHFFMFLSYVVTKIWRTKNTFYEHGICPITEFTSPWLNCAHSNRIPAEIWRFLILIFQDGGRRHLGFSKFQFFNGRNGQKGQAASSCQISSKSLNPRLKYGYFSTFKTFRRHLGLVKF